MLGCFFHFGNCLYKQICDVGLRQEYIDNEELRNWFKRMMALALVPVDEIENVYIHLIDEASELFETRFIVNWKNGSIIFLILDFLMVRIDQPQDFQGNPGIILKIMDQGQIIITRPIMENWEVQLTSRIRIFGGLLT